MEYVWKVVIALISFLLGGLTVHLHHKSKSSVQKTSTKQSNKNGHNINASGGSVVAHDFHQTTSITVEAVPAQKIPELSEQAKSFIRQMIASHSNSIIVFEPSGLVDTIVLFEAKQEMIIEDNLSVPDDLKALELNEYLRYCKKNDDLTGKIYALTPKGRNYGHSLISGTGE